MALLAPLAVLAVLLTPQTPGPAGSVTGTLSLNGVPVTLAFVYASAQPGFFDKSKEDTRVLLSDVPLTEAARKDVFELIKIGREGRGRIVEVVIGADGQPISGSFFAREFDGQVSASGMHTFTRERFDAHEIAGRLVVAPEHEFMHVKFAYDATFRAPIERPASAADKAAALAGAPGQVAKAFVAAVVTGDRASFLNTLAASTRARFVGTPGATAFTDLCDDFPRDSKVVEIVPQPDGTMRVSIEGHRDGMTIGHPVKLVQESGAWRIAMD